MKKLEWTTLTGKRYSDMARGLRYYYKIYASGEAKVLRIESKWNKRDVVEVINNDIDELKKQANEHNDEVVERELAYHENQLKAIKKQWE